MLTIIQTCTQLYPYHTGIVVQYTTNGLQFMIGIILVCDVVATQLRGVFIAFALNKQTLEKSRYLKNELTESEYCLSMPIPNLLSEIIEKKMEIQRIKSF